MCNTARANGGAGCPARGPAHAGPKWRNRLAPRARLLNYISSTFSGRHVPRARSSMGRQLQFRFCAVFRVWPTFAVLHVSLSPLTPCPVAHGHGLRQSPVYWATAVHDFFGRWAPALAIVPRAKLGGQARPPGGQSWQAVDPLRPWAAKPLGRPPPSRRSGPRGPRAQPLRHCAKPCGRATESGHLV